MEESIAVSEVDQNMDEPTLAKASCGCKGKDVEYVRAPQEVRFNLDLKMPEKGAVEEAKMLARLLEYIDQFDAELKLSSFHINRW